MSQKSKKVYGRLTRYEAVKAAGVKLDLQSLLKPVIEMKLVLTPADALAEQVYWNELKKLLLGKPGFEVDWEAAAEMFNQAFKSAHDPKKLALQELTGDSIRKACLTATRKRYREANETFRYVAAQKTMNGDLEQRKKNAEALKNETVEIFKQQGWARVAKKRTKKDKDVAKDAPKAASPEKVAAKKDPAPQVTEPEPQPITPPATRPDAKLVDRK